MMRTISLVLFAALTGCSQQAKLPPTTAAAPSSAADVRPVERVVDGDFAFQGAIMQGGLAVGQTPPGTVSATFDGKPLRLDSKGRFLIGWGRDAGPTSLVEARLPDGTRVREALRVIPRQFKIESIPQLKQYSGPPDPAWDALRSAERARIDAAHAMLSDSAGWTERFIWPAHGRISGVYGSQRILGGVPRDPHAGVDIAAPTGTPVVAPADAVVVLAAEKPFSLEGNLLILDHGNGLYSNFLHLSRIDVKVGDRVAQGQPVGRIGMTGRATGPHLHWALNWGAVRLDAQLLVPPGGNAP